MSINANNNIFNQPNIPGMTQDVATGLQGLEVPAAGNMPRAEQWTGGYGTNAGNYADAANSLKSNMLSAQDVETLKKLADANAQKVYDHKPRFAQGTVAAHFIGNKTDNCADGKDDGKLESNEIAKSVFKGLKSSLIDPFLSVKGLVTTAALSGLAILLPPLVPILIAGGTLLSAGTLVSGLSKVASAETDAEARSGWEKVASGGFGTFASVIGLKGWNNANPAQKAFNYETWTNMPKNLANVFKTRWNRLFNNAPSSEKYIASLNSKLENKNIVKFYDRWFNTKTNQRVQTMVSNANQADWAVAPGAFLPTYTASGQINAADKKRLLS